MLYHGVLAPHCGWRARVVAYGAPAAAPAVAPACPGANDEPTIAPVARHWAWADLMRRAFGIDVLACPRCGGRLRLIATVEDPGAIRAILAALAESRERRRSRQRRLSATRQRSVPERHPGAAVAEVCSLASFGAGAFLWIGAPLW